jgi:glycosyltransferase involved in cell wall biosynthesis
MEILPLISCIMPTYNRRHFVPRAIQYFLRQDYEPKELVIVDDGDDQVANLIPDDARVRYLPLKRRLTVGEKRNLACEQARGEIIAHWDDDDWHAPHRLSYQLEHLTDVQAEVCGLRQMLFLDIATGQTWLYEYPDKQPFWLAGGSLLYTRQYWQRAPFSNISVGEDALFLWSHETRCAVALPDYTFYVGFIHPDNTSLKQPRAPYWSRWSGDIKAILGQSSYGLSLHKPMVERRSEMKLNLGCCDSLLDGYVNVDKMPGPGVEVVDLTQPWPWPENSVDQVRAWDIIEHLADKIFTMNELWRVLKPGGIVEIAVPTTDGTGAFQDPTHVSFWNRRSFLYYEAGNPYRERFAHYYGIQAKFRVRGERTERSVDGPRLTIFLEALKP